MLQLTDEQQAFVEAMRDFAARECGTHEQREAHEEGHDPEIYRRIAELGWVGVSIPEEYGGGGGSVVDLCLLLEETTRGLLPIGSMAVSLIVAGAVERFGTEEQKHEILGGIAGGAVEAIAMTEPEAGSDVGALSTSAERADDGFVLNGQKVFCSNAHIADHVLIVARTTKGENKHEGLSMIFVPVDTFRCVMQAMTARAMSSASTTRLSGVPCAIFSSCGRPRPATKSVATAAGETQSTRMCGPSTRASDNVIVSSAAFDAQ
jgi:alkylation response protein AidB-like acyl-CoA dehydrogenase